jgi:O-acetylhomoserine/O-acetylserine sulfhydrylase-like pyridoxal-dependent enzyme
MLTKCVNTLVLARYMAAHPQINVNCNAVEGNKNREVAQRSLFLGFPAPLFTIDMEAAGIDRHVFQSFFDSLAPTFGHMVSLGQSNTVVLCPALTSHSELSGQALKQAGIAPTTLRIAVGDEDVRELMAHFIEAARSAIEPHYPGFCAKFMSTEDADKMARDLYLDAHARYFDSRKSLADCMK